jgi:hypothetical protein
MQLIESVVPPGLNHQNFWRNPALKRRAIVIQSLRGGSHKAGLEN